MKNVMTLHVLAAFFLTGHLFAQSAGNCDPDSLEYYSTSGIIITQTSGTHIQYLIDEDMDGTEDLILTFGPWWYTPKNKSITRPPNGDTVAIIGGLNPTNPGLLPVLIVYEIDGTFWRNPFEPFWNDFTNQYNPNAQGNGYASGWIDAPLSNILISGTAIVDTTFIYNKYFLDVDSDDSADYHLNFGPYWYEPVADISLPTYGEAITVEGWLIDKTDMPCILVLVLNDSIWRDTSGIGIKEGEWIRSQITTQTRHRAFWDSMSHITVQPGWHTAALPDSLYMQMLQVMVQNMPKYENQHGFAGFEIGMFNKNRQNHMQQNMWHMTFNNEVQLQFHYNQRQKQQFRIREETMALKRWRQQTQTWEQVTGISVDTILNTVYYSTSEIYGFYMLTADMITGQPTIMGDQSVDIAVFPNPANHTTYLQISAATPIAFSVDLLDISGKIVYTMATKQYSGAAMTIEMPTGHLSPGVYFIRLHHKEGVITRKIIRTGN